MRRRRRCRTAAEHTAKRRRGVRHNRVQGGVRACDAQCILSRLACAPPAPLPHRRAASSRHARSAPGSACSIASACARSLHAPAARFGGVRVGAARGGGGSGPSRSGCSVAGSARTRPGTQGHTLNHRAFQPAVNFGVQHCGQREQAPWHPRSHPLDHHAFQPALADCTEKQHRQRQLACPRAVCAATPALPAWHLAI